MLLSAASVMLFAAVIGRLTTYSPTDAGPGQVEHACSIDAEGASGALSA
jgi:hypothetical protein